MAMTYEEDPFNMGMFFLTQDVLQNGSVFVILLTRTSGYYILGTFRDLKLMLGDDALLYVYRSCLCDAYLGTPYPSY